MKKEDIVRFDRRVAVIRQGPHYDHFQVCESVSATAAALGLHWSAFVKPDERVFLKPNFIRESHTERPDEWEQIITHGSVIAAPDCAKLPRA